MGRWPRPWSGVPGLQFAKLLGTGGGNGFAVGPDWSTYGLLAVWDDEAAARHFFKNHPFPLSYAQRAEATQTAFLHTSTAHGQWDGQKPFETTVTFDPSAPVAVLTRATIRRRHLWRFWRQVPGVSKSMDGRPGLIFAKGVGELPWIQQATFSLWSTGQAMLDYAYHGQQHREVIQQTRRLGWYREELFARFVPYRSEGSGFWSCEF